jgi:hypothetical protein
LILSFDSENGRRTISNADQPRGSKKGAIHPLDTESTAGTPVSTAQRDSAAQQLIRQSSSCVKRLERKRCRQLSCGTIDGLIAVGDNGSNNNSGTAWFEPDAPMPLKLAAYPQTGMTFSGS